MDIRNDTIEDRHAYTRDDKFSGLNYIWKNPRGIDSRVDWGLGAC